MAGDDELKAIDRVPISFSDLSLGQRAGLASRSGVWPLSGSGALACEGRLNRTGPALQDSHGSGLLDPAVIEQRGYYSSGPGGYIEVAVQQFGYNRQVAVDAMEEACR